MSFFFVGSLMKQNTVHLSFVFDSYLVFDVGLSGIQSPCDPHRESLRWSPSKAQRGAQRLEQRHGAEGSLRGATKKLTCSCLDEYDKY